MTSGLPSVCATSMNFCQAGCTAQDVADDDLAVVLPGQLRDLGGLFDRLRERLLDEDVAAALDRVAGDGGVGVGVGVDRDHVRLGFGVGRLEVGEGRDAAGAELLGQLVAGCLAAGHQADELEVFELMVGAGMGGTHVAAADDENAQCCHDPFIPCGGSPTQPNAGPRVPGAGLFVRSTRRAGRSWAESPGPRQGLGSKPSGGSLPSLPRQVFRRL